MTKKSHQAATLFTESRFARLPVVPDTKELEGQRFVRRLRIQIKREAFWETRKPRKASFLPAIENFLIPFAVIVDN